MTKCGATFTPMNGETVTACHKPKGHEGDHEGYCLGSRCVWSGGQHTVEEIEAMIAYCYESRQYLDVREMKTNSIARNIKELASFDSALGETLVDELVRRVSELDADRNLWKKCCEDNHYRMILARRALAIGDSTPLAPIADEIARIANDGQCYPFSTQTCDKPGCTCRAEKRDARAANERGEQ